MSLYKEIARRYKTYAAKQGFFTSVALAMLWFIGSIGICSYAIQFATKSASNSVTDIILSNVPVFDVDGLFVYGVFVLIAFIFFICSIHPKRIPFTLHALTLLILTRSLFVSLTHVGPFPTHAASDFGTVITKFFFGNDFFFSNHTAIPFMMALVYWDNKVLRYIFILWSVFFGTIALLGHLHYSIDVLAAFFITFSVYHITLWLFPKDRALFMSNY